jgi:predicted helicase
MADVASKDTERVREQYSIGKDSKSWSLKAAQTDVRNTLSESKLTEILYRPFDQRWTYYTGNQSGIYFFPADVVMKHVVGHPNVGVAFTRKVEGTRNFADVMVFDEVFTLHSLSLKEVNYIAPLYVYPDEASDQSDAFAGDRRVNFHPQLLRQFLTAAGMRPSVVIDRSAEDALRSSGDSRPTEVKVFDYIYGVLHSAAYRQRYAQLLKADFPRIPFPPSPKAFSAISEKGEELRRLHLMEPNSVGETSNHYLGSGDDIVAPGYPKWEGGRVYINANQYFDGVAKLAWEFGVGDYRPAQKWLKDRRGRTLDWQDITRYQRILKILLETDRIMKEIELPLDGGGA